MSRMKCYGPPPDSSTHINDTVFLEENLSALKDKNAHKEVLCSLVKGMGDFSALMRTNEQKGLEMTKASASKYDPPKICLTLSPLGKKQREAAHPFPFSSGKCQCDVPVTDAS